METLDEVGRVWEQVILRINPFSPLKGEKPVSLGLGASDFSFLR